MIIFLLVIIAFVIGFSNLYWYYNQEVRLRISVLNAWIYIVFIVIGESNG